MIFILLSALVVNGQTILQKQSVTPSDLKNWVSCLASDEMRGRANGSAEMKDAAIWIAGKFSEYNIMPILENSEYIQNYSITSRQKIYNERNVIGILPGSESSLKNQYIVLSAHFDHIGIRRAIDGDSIYNGADDNASGISAIIGIAKAIKDSGIKPGRTIIFAAFSGEELGMRGSRYFVANTPFALKDIFVDINFEMIGHSEFFGKNSYYMAGCSFSDLDDIIIERNKQTNYRLIDTISLANSLFYASDNIAFSRISVTDGMTTGIPSGTFATSTMPAYFHSPKDEAALFDFENMAGLVNHFSELVLWLSQYPGTINWTDPGFIRPK